MKTLKTELFLVEMRHNRLLTTLSIVGAVLCIAALWWALSFDFGVLDNDPRKNLFFGWLFLIVISQSLTALSLACIEEKCRALLEKIPDDLVEAWFNPQELLRNRIKKIRWLCTGAAALVSIPVSIAIYSCNSASGEGSTINLAWLLAIPLLGFTLGQLALIIHEDWKEMRQASQ